MRDSRLSRILRLMILVALFGTTGCENGNLFGKIHKSGDSSDIESLASDAENALRDNHFSQALELYEEILNQDPDNAEALYGAAAAAIGSSGLNFATLLSNIMNNNTSAPSFRGLGVIKSARMGSAVAGAAGPNSILDGVDTASVKRIIDKAVCRLQKITAGGADGTLSPENVDLLVSFGIVLIVKAIVNAVELDFMDLENENGDYAVVLDDNATGPICSGSIVLPEFSSADEQKAYIRSIAQDAAGSYALYKKAIAKVPNAKIIADLTVDLENAVSDMLDPDSVSDVPDECIDTFGEGDNGVTVDNFRTYQGPFQRPTGC